MVWASEPHLEGPQVQESHGVSPDKKVRQLQQAEKIIHLFRGCS